MSPLAIHAERLLQDWKEAYARALIYLDTLGVPADARQTLASQAIEAAVAREAWEPGTDAVAQTMRALVPLVVARYPRADGAWDPHEAFLRWRLDPPAPIAATPGPTARAVPRLPARGRGRPGMPPVTRRSMAPEPMERRFLRRLLPKARGAGPSPSAVRDSQQLRRLRAVLPWTRVALRRRLLLGFLVLIPSIVASGFMVSVLPHQASTWLEAAIVLFFGALFGWISIGFWTALLGFGLLFTRRDRFAITRLSEEAARAPLDPSSRTAIIMPICAEPVDRVFAGLRAMHHSLELAGALEHFHFFVLSDTAEPEIWVKEEASWAAWCRDTNGYDRIFYRRRRVRLRRKSGNVADFCRRWGARYRYMITLDADSVMAGNALVALVRMMEAHPEVGMIQTVPTAVNRRSLLARVQQFASRVYGPMFAAGLHYWQLGDGQYWGHNTIIRTAAFMRHCALPRLPGRPPLGGEILSHDFVEAALMGRAGWSLWLAYDLGGSYEEVPSTLLEEMKRDRRWCQGNLQHLRLLFTEGLFGAHRALFLNGVLSYVTALLWFAFLLLSTAQAIENALHEPEYFPHGASLFPEWPVWRPDWALALLAVTGMILFLPKLLSAVLIVTRRRAADYGGVVRVFASVLLEILLSSLLAPIRMVFHSRFVVQNLLGRTVTWRSQTREDAETSWGEALRQHRVDTLVASAWGAALYWLNPDYFWWVTPIIGALILSVPTSVLASRVQLGDRARELGLFVIPEERDPPAELRDLDSFVAEAEADAAALPASERDGFAHAAVDPYINALHRALLGGRRSVRPSIRAARTAMLERAVAEGPGAVGPRDRRVLLSDPESVDRLHGAVWGIEDGERAARWGRPGGASE